jgi:hypothetical protein
MVNELKLKGSLWYINSWQESQIKCASGLLQKGKHVADPGIVESVRGEQAYCHVLRDQTRGLDW